MKKQTIIINLFGGPGTGKSTAAAAAFGLLKLHGVDCELVTEFAKDLVWEDRQKTMEDQSYILSKQHHRLWRLIGNVDIIVTDSPLLLSIVYQPDGYLKSFTNYVVDLFKSYNNLNIFLNRIKEYNPNGRYQTKSEAEDIDKLIKKTLNDYNIPFSEVPGNYTGINTIARKILGDHMKTVLFSNTI